MITFDEALALVAAVAKPLDREAVPLAEAHNRTLAAPVIAMVDAPSRDVSAMDGYAVCEADLPGRLRVAGTAYPGDPPTTLAPATCTRIFTGGPVPDGADRVVIQEDVTREEDFATFGAPEGGRHIRQCGADFRAGAALLDIGRRLDPRALVAVAGADLDEVDVWRKPRLAVLGTGDELVEPGTARDRPGTIPESLILGVSALAEESGGMIVMSRRLRDNLPELEQMAGWALERADLVVVTGGASVGEKDFAKAMVVDHTAMTNQMKHLFAATKVKVPTELGPRGQRMIEALNAAAPADFDKVYLNQQQAAQAAELAMLRVYAEGGESTDIKPAAAKRIPKVQASLDKVQELQAAQPH